MKHHKNIFPQFITCLFLFIFFEAKSQIKSEQYSIQQLDSILEKNYYEEAEVNYMDLSHIAFEKASDERSEQDSSYSVFMFFLGYAHFKARHYDKAILLLLNAEKLQKKYFSNSHKYGRTMNMIGKLYLEIADYANAEKYYQKCLQFNVQKYGADHESSVPPLNNLAIVYRKTLRYEKAIEIYKQCLNIYRTIYDKDHRNYPLVLNNLATVYTMTGRYEEAEPFFWNAGLFIRIYMVKIILNMLRP